MTAEVLFFDLSAFAALVVLVRHAVRTSGAAEAAREIGFLAGFAVFREMVVAALCRVNQVPPPYTSLTGMGQVGPVNVVVASGWVFCTYCSFHLSRLIQRTAFPGTNVFLTFALTALVAGCISYGVETTGTRVGLWVWSEVSRGRVVPWLPFGWPVDALDGWAATSFWTAFAYRSFRDGLLSPVRWKGAALTVGLVALYALADLGVTRFPVSPRKVLTVAIVIASAVLGFVAPPRMCGLRR